MVSALSKSKASNLLKDIEASQRILVSGALVPSPSEPNNLNARLVWKDRDLVNGVNLLTETQYFLHGTDSIFTGLPSAISSQYVSYSPSYKWFVIISDTDDKLVAQFAFYNQNRLVHVHRTTKDLHGGVYTGASEGGICWSEDESYIFYLAEQKEKEGKSYWANANAPDVKPEEIDLVGAQYEHKEDWGEQYVGKRTSRIFTMQVASGKCSEVNGIPDTMTCSEVAIIPRANTILFTAIDTKDTRRLGLIYCFNRPKKIYSLELTDGSTPVRLPSIAATNTRSARVSPNGKLIAFLGTKEVVTHNTCNILCVLDWETKVEREVIPIVNTPTPDYTSNPTTSFNGLYMLALLTRCWSKDSEWIYFNTDVGARTLWKVVKISTGEVSSPVYDAATTGSETILDLCGNHALVAVSTPQTPASVHWIQLDTSRVTRRTPVAVQSASNHIQSWRIESIPAPSSERKFTEFAKSALPLQPVVFNEDPFEAIVLFPNTKSVPNGGHPVVLDLHGGPHGHSPATYRASYTYLCALGYAVVSVNYRGSTGYGLAPLESLVGKVGAQDVVDCHEAMKNVLNKYPTLLNATRVHVSGGSHGGFLGSHLIAQYPSFYKSAVLRNPVTNLTSLFFTSDIPDWGCAVSGIAAFESIGKLPVEQANRQSIINRLWEVSPMSNDLTAVTTPVLLGLGGKDRRVPPTEGLQLFHSLKRHGIEVQVKWYPEDCHPLDSVKTYADFAVSWALWLAAHDTASS